MSISILFNIYDFLTSNEFRDFWLTAEQKRKRICPIGKMPRLALNQVIQSMDYLEQIKLALTSKRMEYCVKTAKINIALHVVYFRDEVSSIEIDYPTTAALFCGNQIYKTDIGVTRNELAKWCEKNSVTENMVDVYKKLQCLIPSNDLALVLVPDDMKQTTVKEALSISAFQKYSALHLCGEKIESDDLKHIMETAKSDIEFYIVGMEVPVDFRSEHAFKFSTIEYEDARWVQVEDLYSLRNNNLVILGKNNFKSSDYNALIKNWVNCYPDTFEALIIDIDENTELAVADILNDLVVLECYRFDLSFYFLAAKNTENRRSPILWVDIAENDIVIYAKSLDESISVIGTNHKFRFKNELDILKLLERKDELEKELVNTEDREQEIREELQEVNDKLDEFEVHFENIYPFPYIL